jgi:hypothetical protein
MATETEIHTWLATLDTLAAEHPDWAAYAVLAKRARALYDASRQQWRGQSPLIDVSAVEGAYDLTPAVLAIKALGVGEGGAAAMTG